jgi:outer membrane protein
LRILPFAAAIALVLPAAAHAQDTATAGAPPTPNADVSMDGDRVTIGLGVATVPEYEGADANDIIPGAVAVGTLGGYDFFTRGTQLYVDLVKDPAGPGTKFEFGPIAAGRIQRNSLKGIDDLRVRALGKVDVAYELGAFAGVSRTGVITSDFDTLTARVGFVHDLGIGDAHGSYVITPQINYSTPLSIRNLVSLGVSADYVGKGYGRTYFGVTPGQSLASTLRSYSIGDSGWKNYSLSAFAVQSLSGDLRRGLGIGAGVLYTQYLGKYKRSPLVRDAGDSSTFAAAVGLTYTF